jgi:hypothetical protein
MPTLRDDLSFGLSSETNNRAVIEQFLDVTLEKTDSYSVMDWADNNKTVYVELKTRRIRHDAYPTAIIGANKVAFCSDPNKEYYFCYSYLDGLYYIKYDAEVFAQFERDDNYERGFRPDASNISSKVVFIPVNLLNRFP